MYIYIRDGSVVVIGKVKTKDVSVMNGMVLAQGVDVVCSYQLMKYTSLDDRLMNRQIVNIAMCADM